MTHTIHTLVPPKRAVKQASVRCTRLLHTLSL